MPGFRKLKRFILREGECAAEWPLCSGPHVQCMSRHHGQRRRNCTGQDERLWGATESYKGLEPRFSSCLLKGWRFIFCACLFVCLEIFLRQHKHILETFSELMFRDFFTTGTVTRDIVKVNWFFGGEKLHCCVGGQNALMNFSEIDWKYCNYRAFYKL